MRIVLTTVGSRGDVEPYLALAVGLQRAGHEVLLSSAARFALDAHTHGVPYAPTSDSLFDLMEEPLVLAAMETMTDVVQMVRQAPRLVRLAGEVQRTLVAESWEALQDATPDVVVFHPKAFWGPAFAAHLGATAILAPLQPFYISTGERPLPGAPQLPFGAAYNRLTYSPVRFGVAASARRYLADWRRQTGGRNPNGVVPTVHGFSRHVVPEPEDWPAWATTAGYWFLEKEADLAPDLSAFLEAGPAPVYVGFGSMAGRKPERTTQIVLEALQRAEVRGIVATGWGGIGNVAGDDLFVVEGAPHELLFPRCAAVVHHGGVGTTAAGLRAGRPSVVCPFFGDQPFWGRCVQNLGAGPAPLLQKTLTAEALAEAIRAAVSSDSIREHAEAVGTAIRAEDGIEAAVQFVERWGAAV